MNWISVKDRLPEKYIPVIFAYYVDSYELRGVAYGVRKDSGGIYMWAEIVPNDTFYYSEQAVTHWMPLPEPPEVEE